MDLNAQARELVTNLRGRMGPSPYDVAWMARVLREDGKHPRWPELTDWLIDHQWIDGSWGGVVRYYHDRVICTLASIIALKEVGRGQDVEHAIDRGQRYVWHNLHRLRHDPFESVGFELILPTLLVQALDLGLDVPRHTCGYGRIREEKLGLIPPALLYSPQVTTVHSLEFLGKEGDAERMGQALAVNGSLGNSPATTSYYLLRGGDDERAWRYLEGVLSHNGHVTYLHPFRAFELSWVLHALSFCGRSLENLVDESTWDWLAHNLSEKGAGLDPTFGIEDCDVTSVTMYLLRKMGREVDPTILTRFEDKARYVFRTYDYERNVSIGTNVHALEALSLLPDYPNRDDRVDQVLAFILADRLFDTYWVDKWHASPYYATSHALVGIARACPRMVGECLRTVDWLTHTQREDGSWGYFDRGTVEETAYALIGLLYACRYTAIDRSLFYMGADYLCRYVMKKGAFSNLPALWIGKPLFIPQDIVRASVLSALMLYESTFDSLPR